MLLNPTLTVTQRSQDECTSYDVSVVYRMSNVTQLSRIYSLLSGISGCVTTSFDLSTDENSREYIMSVNFRTDYLRAVLDSLTDASRRRCPVLDKYRMGKRCPVIGKCPLFANSQPCNRGENKMERSDNSFTVSSELQSAIVSMREQASSTLAMYSYTYNTHIQKATTELERLYSQLLSTDNVRGLVDQLSKLLKSMDEYTTGLFDMVCRTQENDTTITCLAKQLHSNSYLVEGVIEALEILPQLTDSRLSYGRLIYDVLERINSVYRFLTSDRFRLMDVELYLEYAEVINKMVSGHSGLYQELSLIRQRCTDNERPKVNEQIWTNIASKTC